MTPLEGLLTHLREMHFAVEERAELFGEPLPHLKAVAMDPWAHQLVLVAEEARSKEGEPQSADLQEGGWRDLIFALSGLRHHLRGSGLPALSSPLLLALVDDDSDLRTLVEEISGEYALFARLDINIVERSKTDADGYLDRALTSVLPRVRRALRDEVTVATQDVERFWDDLSQEIEQTAKGLEEVFGAKTACDSVLAVRRVLRADEASAPSRAEVAPLRNLEIENFRSFAAARVDVPAVGIVHGANGTGKTSLCEVMEILWSGRSNRIPEGIKAADYERHLKRDGKPFRLRGQCGDNEEPIEVLEIAEEPRTSLGRTVLPQQSVGEMASGTPQERFRAFLTASGLELPDFEARVVEARKKMHEEANAALGQAGIEGIRAVNVNGLNHLRTELEATFAAGLPSDADVEGAAEALARITDGAYQAKAFPFGFDSRGLWAAVEDADSALRQVQARLDQAPDPTAAVEAAAEILNRESERLTSSSAPLRQLLDHMRDLASSEKAQMQPSASSTPVSPRLAAQWLGHARGIVRSIPELQASLETIEDQQWRSRLQSYIAALRAAVEASSSPQLEQLVAMGEEPSARVPRTHSPPPLALLEASGFSREPVPSKAVLAAMENLYRRRAEYAAALSRQAAALLRHPGPFFSARAARVMPALCDFELAREIAKPTGAVTRARETLVGRLLGDRLKPVVQELVSALVRFEWYFEEPLEVAVKGREMRMWGLSNSDPNLDLRMLLNEAERTVVGIAWFLALHILQPESSRQVLVLDDPASGFDETNKAAFVATLRSLLHMLKPKQFLITTHDDAMVALLEQELGQVDAWPPELTVLRCRRHHDGASEIPPEEPKGLSEADLERELGMLALQDEETSAAHSEHR